MIYMRLSGAEIATDYLAQEAILRRIGAKKIRRKSNFKCDIISFFQVVFDLFAGIAGA